MADFDLFFNEGELWDILPTYSHPTAGYYGANEARGAQQIPYSAKITLPSAETTVFAGFRMSSANTSGSSFYPSFSFLDAAGDVLGELVISIGWDLGKLRGPVGAGTADSDSFYYRINGAVGPYVTMKIDTVAGVLSVALNDVIIRTLAINVTSTPVATIRLSNTTVSQYVPQLWASNKARPFAKVSTKQPNAAGTYVASSGTYLDVDEIITDTAVVSLNAAGNKQSVKSVSRTVDNNVIGFSVTCVAAKADNTGPQSIRPFVVISGTVYYGPTFALLESAKGFYHNFAVNPATSGAWTAAVLNAATFEYGWEAVA